MSPFDGGVTSTLEQYLANYRESPRTYDRYVPPLVRSIMYLSTVGVDPPRGGYIMRTSWICTKEKKELFTNDSRKQCPRLGPLFYSNKRTISNRVSRTSSRLCPFSKGTADLLVR